MKLEDAIEVKKMAIIEMAPSKEKKKLKSVIGIKEIQCTTHVVPFQQNKEIQSELKSDCQSPTHLNAPIISITQRESNGMTNHLN